MKLIQNLRVARVLCGSTGNKVCHAEKAKSLEIIGKDVIDIDFSQALFYNIAVIGDHLRTVPTVTRWNTLLLDLMFHIVSLKVSTRI